MNNESPTYASEESSPAGRFQSLLDAHTHQNGYIDIRGLADSAKIEINQVEMKNEMLVAHLFRDENKNKRLEISPMFTFQEQNCAIAWVMAEYIISLKNLIDNSFSCNVFLLREFRQNRFSRTAMLATRLLMTEEAISKMADLDNSKLQKDLSPYMTSEFSNSSIKGETLTFLMRNSII